MKRRVFLKQLPALLLLPKLANTMSHKPIEKINTTGFLFDPIFLQHSLGEGHPESPERIQTTLNFLKKTGLLTNLEEIDCFIPAEKWLLTIHNEAHLNAIEENYKKTHLIAVKVVSGVLSAVHEVCQGKLKNAFCLTRPPGHHALNTGKEEGFCFYNSIAIAARYAQQEFHLKNILIIDWDYHHGNATEASFYTDPSVLFFSTHDFYAYPGTGDPKKMGQNMGYGYNINVHLPCGTGDNDFIKPYQDILLPIAHRFKPDLILISAGFDSRKDDLLGCFNVTDTAYIQITKQLMELADQYADGRIVSILEGGYTPDGVASAAYEHIKTLLSL